MARLKIVYILLLVMLGVLTVFTVFKPFATDSEYGEVQRTQLLQAKDEWIIQFDIINREGKDTKYTIDISVAGKQYHEEFLIQSGGLYTYIHHIRRDMVGAGEGDFTIYKKGEDRHLRKATYYLR